MHDLTNKLLLGLAAGLLTLSGAAWAAPLAAPQGAATGNGPSEQKPMVFPGQDPEPPSKPEVFPGNPGGGAPTGEQPGDMAPTGGDGGGSGGGTGGGGGFGDPPGGDNPDNGTDNGPPTGGPDNPGGGAGAGPPTGPSTGPPAPGSGITPISGFIGVDEVDPTGLWSWFELRRDSLLELDSRLGALGVESGSSEFFLGRGIAGAPRAKPTAGPERKLAAAVAIELLEIAERDRRGVLVQSALIALGQIYPALERDLAERVDAVFQARLSDAEQAIQEGAVIGCALTGATSQLQVLAGLAGDSDVGRRSARLEVVPFRLRAFSAYGLGLAGRQAQREDIRRFAVHHLVEILEGEGGARNTGALPDVDAAALLALGMAAGGPLEAANPSGATQPPSASRSAALRYLIGALEDGRRYDRRVRAILPGALMRVYMDLDPSQARQLRPFVAEPLLEIVDRARKEPNELLRGTAIALGALGDADDSPLSERLRNALFELAEVPDRRTNTLAVLSLGEVIGRPGAGPALRAFQSEGLNWLAKRTTRGGTLDRPTAALALALAVKGAAQSGVTCPRFVREALVEAAGDARSPDEIGATAIAVGLASIIEATPALQRSFERASALETRGRVALGLGLLGAAGSADDIAGWAAREQANSIAVRDGAIALALLDHGPRAVELAANHLLSRSSLDQESGARALGAIGDVPSGELLLGLLASRERPARARAMAALSLGRMLDVRETHSFDALSDVANPFAGIDSLYRATGGPFLDGLLDLEPGF